MSVYDRVVDQSRRKRLLYYTLIFGVAIPIVVLGVLYAGSRIVSIDFGTILFGLTLLASLACLLFAGWGKRMDAARPTGELFRNSGTDYAKEVSQGHNTRLPLPARLVIIATGTIVLGWLAVIATL